MYLCDLGCSKANVLLEHAPRISLIPGLGIRLLCRLTVERKSGLQVCNSFGSGLYNDEVEGRMRTGQMDHEFAKPHLYEYANGNTTETDEE